MSFTENFTINEVLKDNTESGELEAITNYVSNISNSIVKAAAKEAQPKVIQMGGPYISRISGTRFKAEDLVGDPALLQIELPEGHYFADGTNLEELTFKVKSPGTIDEIKLDIMNKDGKIVDRINYQLLWAA